MIKHSSLVLPVSAMIVSMTASRCSTKRSMAPLTMRARSVTGTRAHSA